MRKKNTRSCGFEVYHLGMMSKQQGENNIFSDIPSLHISSLDLNEYFLIRIIPDSDE